MAISIRSQGSSKTSSDRKRLPAKKIPSEASTAQAIAYAALIPGAAHGSVEIRPIVDWAATGMGAPIEAASAV